MKKVVVIILAVLFASPAFSQLKFGVKAGLNTTSLKMEDIKTLTSSGTNYTVEALKGANYGFHFGGFMRLKILALYIEPELLFSTRTNEYTVTNLSSSAGEIVKQKFNKLDIPVMVGVKLGPIRVHGGPAATLLINSPKDIVDDPNFESMYSRMTIGYQAGLGFDLLKTLTFDLRYEGSLKKYQNKINNLTGTTFNLDDRPNAFLFSVGIMF